MKLISILFMIVGIGWLALARTHKGEDRTFAIFALTVGLIDIVASLITWGISYDL